MSEEDPGLINSLRGVVSTLIDIVSTRLELLANEWEEERLYLTRMLLISLSMLFCFGLGIILLTFFIIVIFWDDHRLAVLGLLTVLFFAMGALMALLLRHTVSSKAKLFSVSLAELTKDREQLGAKDNE
jgi:uncharacterized membrane protein YqjE